MTQLDSIIGKLRAQFGSAIQAVDEFRGETTVTLAPKDVAPVARFLRDDPELRFDHLEDLTSVDRSRYPGMAGAPRFAVVYQLLSTRSGQRIRLKAAVAGDNPVVPTITGLWPGANWHERE
ncbi:MAG: NADH-quinone oxidoreductase subunit C, partial [Anaerolineae bacterium]